MRKRKLATTIIMWNIRRMKYRNKKHVGDEEATEKAEINIFDDLNELINEINQQSISKIKFRIKENEDEHNTQTLSSSANPSIQDSLMNFLKMH